MNVDPISDEAIDKIPPQEYKWKVSPLTVAEAIERWRITLEAMNWYEALEEAAAEMKRMEDKLR